MQYTYMIIDNLPNDPHSLSDLLFYIKSCGYVGVELNLTSDVLDNLDRIEEALGTTGMITPSFLTGAAYNEGLCMNSPDSDIRQKTVDLLISYLDVARRFNAILVFGLLQGLLSDEPDPDIANERIFEGLRAVGEEAVQKGVEVVVEPVNHLQVGFNNSVAEVRHLIQQIGSPALRPMVDTIHMNIEDPSLTQPIYDCGETLRHVHLCESNGSYLGSGNIDFGSVLNALDDISYEGFASIKVYRKAKLRDAISGGITHLRNCR